METVKDLVDVYSDLEILEDVQAQTSVEEFEKFLKVQKTTSLLTSVVLPTKMTAIIDSKSEDVKLEQESAKVRMRIIQEKIVRIEVGVDVKESDLENEAAVKVDKREQLLAERLEETKRRSRLITGNKSIWICF